MIARCMLSKHQPDVVTEMLLKPENENDFLFVSLLRIAFKTEDPTGQIESCRALESFFCQLADHLEGEIEVEVSDGNVEHG